MNNEKNRWQIIYEFKTPKNGKHRDKRQNPEYTISKLQKQVKFLRSRVEALNMDLSSLDAECSDLYRENQTLTKRVQDVEILPKTWRKVPDSDGWKESCALDVEVALGLFKKCPLDGNGVHPRCMNLFDGICKSSTGLCSSAKKHIG
jgi:hypothetical protein